MDQSSLGEERPSPPPRPVADRPPGDRPKIGPRVPTKQQPPLPKRPPVASKPTLTTNGILSDSGTPVFPKTPPPLPSVPPCASPRETPKPPVPAPRRLSQLLSEGTQEGASMQPLSPGTKCSANKQHSVELTEEKLSPAKADQQAQWANNDSVASVAKQREEMKDNFGMQDSVPENEVVKAPAPSPCLSGGGKSEEAAPPKQTMAPRPQRPMPPAKPMVKPKPKIKNKLPTSSIQTNITPVKLEPVEASDLQKPDFSGTETLKQEEDKQVINETEEVAQENIVKPVDKEADPATKESNHMENNQTNDISEESDSVKQSVSENGTAVKQKVMEPEKQIHEVSQPPIPKDEPCETPKKPPRKKKMNKSLSQGSISAEVVEDKALPMTSCENVAKGLQKQDNFEHTPDHPEPVMKESPKIKRRPSRKAPPPPLAVPKQSVELTTDLPVKPNTAEIDNVDSHKNCTVTHDDNARNTTTVKDKQKNSSRDSSPQPGRLNIKNLEASMGLSIGKGLQHQMTSNTRPKPKPKPPLLSPKPKLPKPMAEGETIAGRKAENSSHAEKENTRFSRTPSYSQAVISPKSPNDIKNEGEKEERSLIRNPSYSQALDDEASEDVSVIEEGVAKKRDSVALSGVTVTSSTDSTVEQTDSLDHTEKRKPAIPGMVRVLPIDLSLSKLKVQNFSDKSDVQIASEDADRNQQDKRRRSKTVDEVEMANDESLKRSQTVEALLDVATAHGKAELSSGEIQHMKKSNSAGDILKNKSDSLKGNKPIFVPPSPPPYSELEVAEEAAARTKSMQCPSVGEDTENEPVKHSVNLDDQVFIASDDDGCKIEENDSDDTYEPIEVPKDMYLSDDDSDDPDHIYEPLPELPPKTRLRQISDNIDIPPVRPPKRPRALRAAPPPPPTLSPPTTPMSAGNEMNFGSPPLPPRLRPCPSPNKSPILSRSPSDMYDKDGYLEPVTHPDTGEIYSYADVPDYPFEKSKSTSTPPEKKSPPPKRSSTTTSTPRKSQSPEPLPPREKRSQKRESMASIASVRTSGGSHIYEPIGSSSGSLKRENPPPVVPEQRISGKSIFYFDIGDEEKEPAIASKVEEDGESHFKLATDDLKSSLSTEQNIASSPRPGAESQETSVSESQQEADIEAQEKALDTPIPAPPQPPPRLKRLQPRANSSATVSAKKSHSTSSESSDDYIYPDDPDMVSPENSMYQKDEGESKNEEGIYHEPDEKDESVYNEADESEAISETVHSEADESGAVDESIYTEADDSAVECPSESTSGVVSPSTPPPPVPPRDHHKSEPFPHAIRQALNLQRQASALSDTSFIIGKKLKPVPKTVSFESQLTDSALSLSPASEGVVSPMEKPSGLRKKQRSISNPAIGNQKKKNDSFHEDSASNSSDRPSSWASSGDGYEDPTDMRHMRKLDDTSSITSSIHPGSMVFSHGSGSSLNSEPSDMSDGELEEWLKEKAEKRKRKIQNVAQEIMTSEETFVDVLKLLNIDFRMAMAKATEAQEHVIVPPSVMNQILQYLPQVQNFNEELLSDLKERVNNWENNPRVGDIFVRKGPFLKMYTFYIREFENSMTALDDARKKYSDFDTAVKDFEASPRCRNLLIKHYMLKPIQRIPQYRLLLQEYQKYLTPEHIDYKDTQAALVIVSEVAEHANQSMKYGDNFKKLWEIQSSLIGQFEVINPGREFIKEGLLHKLSRKVMQPRMFFLFSDVLLYTTPVSGGYKLNNHIPLTGVRVSLPTKEDFQNEFSIISTQRSFTISASTAQERDEWLTTLETAIKENAKRRSSFDVRKLHKIPSVLVEVEKDLTLGTRAPVWVPDARVSMCMLCTAEFHVTFRRHHCRACGKVVCGYCSDYRAPLRYLKYKAARVCIECYRKLSKEFDEEGTQELPKIGDGSDKDSSFSRASIKARFRGITWGSYRKASKAKRPAVLQEVSANDEVADMSGYLKVWKSRKWKKLWFVLKGKALYTFKASEDAAAIESIVLLGYEVQNFDSWFEGVEPSLVFQIRHSGTEAMVFRTESTASRDKWLNAIREATIP